MTTPVSDGGASTATERAQIRLRGGATREDVHRGIASLQTTMEQWDAQSTEAAIAETWRVLRLRGWVELAAFECGAINDGENARWARVRGHAVRYVQSSDAAVKAATMLPALGQRGHYLVPGRLVAGREAVYDADAWSSAHVGTAKESDVTWSAVLCVDADPKRPANTSATREQWLAAVGVAGFVRETLLAAGAPEGALGVGHSGNGAHVHLYLDVAWSDEVKALRVRVLRALGALCHYVSGPATRVSIDQTLADGARYIPLYGTMKRKGGRGHDDRPWRKTALIGPEVVTPLDSAGLRRLADALEAKVTTEAIEFWEAEWSKKATTTAAFKGARSTPQSRTTSPTIFDDVNRLPMSDVAAHLGVDLSKCPRCKNPKGAGVTKHPTDGIDLFHCFHDSCSAKANWSNASLILHVKAVTDGDKKRTFAAVAEVAQHFGIAVPSSRDTKPEPPSKTERVEAFRRVMSKIGGGAGDVQVEPVEATRQSVVEEPVRCADAAPAEPKREGAEGTAVDSPVSKDALDIDELLEPALRLDAIRREKVLQAIHDRHKLPMGALRARLLELEEERTSDAEERDDDDQLGAVLSEIQLVAATNCRVFAIINGEVIPADSPKLKARIAYLFNERTGGRVATTAIETALAPMFGADIPHGVVPVRAAYGKDGTIWIDLGSMPRRYVHITPKGVTTESACPIAFYRPSMMDAMPEPVFPKDDAECASVFSDAQRHFQIDRPRLASAYTYAVGVIRPGEPYDGGKLTEYLALLVTGPQGSGKTTFADSWSQTVDPKVTPHFKLARDDEALAILAENTRSLVFNNLSNIPEWASNALCELADGGGMVLRSLYTNRDPTVFRGSNAVTLVSIGDVALAPDLLDRALTIALPERSEYIEPELVEAEFQKLRPRLLGALLYCASRGLRDSGTTTAPKGVRMAGAARWALASAPAGGFTHEEIAAAFAGAIDDADEQVLDHPIVVALQDVVTTDTAWSGTTADLLAALTLSHETRVPDTGAPTKRLPKKWPESPRGLASALRKLAKTLTRSGFTFEWPTGGGRGGRVLSITRAATAAPKPERRSATATNVGMSVDEDDTGDLAARLGTVGTMPPMAPRHRSSDEITLGNDRTGGNDPLPKMQEENEEYLVTTGGRAETGLLPQPVAEAVRGIVPTVPPLPHQETCSSDGRIQQPAIVPTVAANVPLRPDEERSVHARPVWATWDGVRLTVALLAEGEAEDTEPSIFEFSRSLAGAENMLINYGWTGGRGPDGALVGFAHTVVVTTRHHLVEGRPLHAVQSAMRVLDAAS